MKIYEKWFENEQPVTIETKSGVIRFYPQAKRLQISRPDYFNAEGERLIGKTVTISLQSFADSGKVDELANMFETVVACARECTQSGADI